MIGSVGYSAERRFSTYAFVGYGGVGAARAIETPGAAWSTADGADQA
jgi:hypothetical protein